MSTLDIAQLRAELADFYTDIQFVEEVGSTNTHLMRAENVADGTVLLTNSQTDGKGRLGRKWVAPKGTQVTFSVLMIPTSLEHLGTLPLAAGLAVTDAIAGTKLKWPNDVLLSGKKLCGILAEVGPVGSAFKSPEFKAGEVSKTEVSKAEVSKAEVSKAEVSKAEVSKAELSKAEIAAKTQADQAPSVRLVLGMGINVSLQQEDLPVPTATSLVIAGREDDRTGVAIAVLKSLRKRLNQWQEQDPQMMKDYRAVCSSIGMDVRLEAPTGNVVGVVEGIADDGRINVDGVYYSAGDVIHLRPVD